MSMRCHACNREGCYSSSASCFARCNPWPRVTHVCSSVRSGGGGCENCGHLCHRFNADPLCAFYNRSAGQLAWRASEQELLDTQPGTEGRVRHMNQLAWHWNGDGIVVVGGRTYDVGRGNPGGFNDCLIDSLRQCLDLDTDPRMIREDLTVAFADAKDERARVTSNSFLDLDSHWQVFPRALFRHNTCGVSRECDLQLYCINTGQVVGDIGAPRRLVIMNTSDMHFDPCLPR